MTAHEKWFPGVPDFGDVHTKDATLHFPGESRFAGSHRGDVEVHRLLYRLTRVARSARSFKLEWTTLDNLDDEKHGVQLGTYRLVLNDDVLEDRFAIVVDLAESGLVSDIWLHVANQAGLDRMLKL